MRLWRSLPGFRGESRIETWIYRIALNAAMTSLQATVRQRELKSAVTAAAPTDLGQPSDASAADVLARFLRMLGEVDASILMMHLDGLSTEEMGDVLGITANAINVRLTRLRQKFIDTFVD